MCLCFAPALSAQDAAKVDPKHYTVISENDQVRILKCITTRIEVSHAQPSRRRGRVPHQRQSVFNFADGKKENMDVKAGGAQSTVPTVHLPENTGDTVMDAIVIELKAPKM